MPGNPGNAWPAGAGSVARGLRRNPSRTEDCYNHRFSSLPPPAPKAATHTQDQMKTPASILRIPLHAVLGMLVFGIWVFAEFADFMFNSPTSCFGTINRTSGLAP